MATTHNYPLSLHDALPIYVELGSFLDSAVFKGFVYFQGVDASGDRELWRTDGTPAGTTRVQDLRAVGSSLPDRKSTRLNSSHLGISYAVFCLKKKKRNLNYKIDATRGRYNVSESPVPASRQTTLRTTRQTRACSLANSAATYRLNTTVDTQVR